MIVASSRGTSLCNISNSLIPLTMAKSIGGPLHFLTWCRRGYRKSRATQRTHFFNVFLFLLRHISVTATVNRHYYAFVTVHTFHFQCFLMDKPFNIVLQLRHFRVIFWVFYKLRSLPTKWKTTKHQMNLLSQCAGNNLKLEILPITNVVVRKLLHHLRASLIICIVSQWASFIFPISVF